jgi:hypothetical protein
MPILNIFDREKKHVKPDELYFTNLEFSKKKIFQGLAHAVLEKYL